MDNKFTQFVVDVQQKIYYPDSTIKDNAIIVKVQEREFTIDQSELRRYYDSFVQSPYVYPQWVTRTAGHVNQLIEQWAKRWN